MYKASQNRLRMRMYNVLKDIRRQHAFVPIVMRPSLSPDYRPRVNWSDFHETISLEKAPTLYRSSLAPRTIAEGHNNLFPRHSPGERALTCWCARLTAVCRVPQGRASGKVQSLIDGWPKAASMLHAQDQLSLQPFICGSTDTLFLSTFLL